MYEDKPIKDRAAQGSVANATSVAVMDGQPVDAWLMDLDRTLYPPTVDLFPQFDARVRDYIVRLLDVSIDEAAELQKTIWEEYGNSLRGLMALHDCSPHDFISHIHEIDLSAIELAPDLDELLDRLPGRKLIFTSGSALHAERVTDRLGVRRHFEAIYDIAASGFKTKPEISVYVDLLDRYGIDPARAVMLDDVLPNLKPAHDLGMRTVWVRTEPQDQTESSGACAYVHHQTDDLTHFLRQWLGD